MEPLVRLLEDTPQERTVEAVAERVRAGLSYGELLTALQLATIRSMKPHPLGFAFHSVLAINSAHLASLATPMEYRWLPIFWAINYFKEQQPKASPTRWALPAPKESQLPSPSKARQAFIAAMDAWDEEAADVAMTALARYAGEQEIFELLVRYGSRDFRSIGHKAIFVANSRRALDCIGWQHAEPVLRSLARGLLDFKGKNPATYEAPDQSGKARQCGGFPARAEGQGKCSRGEDAGGIEGLIGKGEGLVQKQPRWNRRIYRKGGQARRRCSHRQIIAVTPRARRDPDARSASRCRYSPPSLSEGAKIPLTLSVTPAGRKTKAQKSAAPIAITMSANAMFSA
jgi:hypothetical protein